MTAVRRTAVAAALVLGAAGCTADTTRGVATPAERGPFTELLGTVDLDAAVDADVRLYDLAALPGGGWVALLGGESGDSYVVEIAAGDDGPGVGRVRRVPAVRPGADVVPTPGGAVLVVGTAEATGELQLLTADGGTTPLGPPTDAVATALSPDGGVLHIGAGTRLIRVDLSTRETTGVDVPAPVTHLATGSGGGLTALLAVDRGDRGPGVLLARYDGDLQQSGEPVELVPEGSSARPAGLQVTDDGTAVVALGEQAPGPSRPRLLTVADGRIGTTIDLRATEDSGLDLAVDPGGRYAHVPLAAYQVEPGVVTFDLGTGERVGEVVLCPTGAGSLGAAALAADGGTLTVSGVCLGEGLVTTAFVVG